MSDDKDHLAVIALDVRDADWLADRLTAVADRFATLGENTYEPRRLRRLAGQIRGAIPADAS